MTSRYFLFNQMAGPLFRELACAVAERAENGAVLFTGHPDTLAFAPKLGNLAIFPMPAYDRRSKRARLTSWLHYTACALLQVFRMSKNSEAAIFVSNPPTMALVALLGRLFGRRYFVLVYDLHPDALVSMGSLAETSPITRTWRCLNRLVWNASEGVFTIGNRMAKRLSVQFSPEKTRLGHVEVVPIWVDTEVIKPVRREENSFAHELGVGERTVVLYSGNMGYSHDIESILHAAERLSDRQDIVFVLIGEGAKWHTASQFAKDRRLSNLHVLPFQPEHVLPLSLAMADIALVSLDGGAEGLMIPSKTYYYMAAGSAVIAICEGETELGDTLSTAKCGLQVPPRQPEALAASIRSLAADRSNLEGLKAAARAHCVAHHDRAACTSRFTEILSKQGV